jgi:RNA polymerase sigma factor for flagellar operon FliA
MKQATVDASRNEAMLQWYPMVTRIANRVAATYGLPQSVDTSDLVSSGVIGLAEAWERYDPARNVAFEAFAIPRVKGAIVDAIRGADWVSRKVRQRAREKGEPLLRLVSLDRVSPSGEGESPVDYVVDEDAPQPGADLIAAESRREVLAALNRLPERERMIVTLYYFERVPLGEIARSLGLSAARISQLHTAGLRMLREALPTRDEPAAA